MLAPLVALAAFGIVMGGVVWLSRRHMEETFGHLRSRREEPDEVFDVEETLQEASKWL